MSDIAERVQKIVVEHLGVDELKVTEEANSCGDDFVDLVEKLEKS